MADRKREVEEMASQCPRGMNRISHHVGMEGWMALMSADPNSSLSFHLAFKK